ncbi:DUF397 domain-containing protein [Streptomyces sp. AJS327]|uniref:DUF397 domain-containing protein n=1 Tax=Streptomyces sp. AJS327 TaxID=2545265 RepID=UPI0015DEC995|nr:DUF397 domain-containing protein [Streptomyces sp. AJS327]MBA0050068.1 DUF397 domain-containing protein [Streptomyces sp. AJS327]
MTDHINNASTLHGWRKSSHSNTNSGSCVEIIDGHPRGIPVRDSKTPSGPALVIPTTGWSTFVTAIKGGEFDN